MKFLPTPLDGVYLIEPEYVVDDRGFFARTYCRKEFIDHGLNPNLAQCNISFNATAGTLRGMHYQAAPFAETKLVRCTQGKIFDVVVDLRTYSTTFKKWFSSELTAANRRALYIPEGCAHGFITLEDQTEVFYQMSEFFHPEYAAGVRWNDPAFSIQWPIAPVVISEKDRSYPAFCEKTGAASP